MGAGLAGLAASMDTGAPCYEAADHIGGVAASDSVDGFTFDRGIHVLQTQSDEVLQLLDELGVEFEIHRRDAHIYSHGCYSAYPFQVNTAGLPLGLRLRCVSGFLRRDKAVDPANYEDWIYKHIGAGFAETFLIPYSEKFWTIHPRELTHDWMEDRIPTPSTWQVLRGAVWNKQTAIGTNATFRYPRMGRGYGSLATALSKRAGEIHLGHRAVRLDAAGHRIHFETGGTVDYEILISTIPLPDLARIAVDAPSEVREAASRLRTNSILVVNLGIDRPDISEKHWVHFPEKQFSFFRISFPHNFDRATVPPGMSSISAEVAYSASAPLDRTTIVDRVIEDLRRVGSIPRGAKVVSTGTRDIQYGYCIYDQHRLDALRRIHGWMKSVDLIPAGRYGQWTYYWSDQSLLSGRKAAAQAMKRLSANG